MYNASRHQEKRETKKEYVYNNKKNTTKTIRSRSRVQFSFLFRLCSCPIDLNLKDEEKEKKSILLRFWFEINYILHMITVSWFPLSACARPAHSQLLTGPTAASTAAALASCSCAALHWSVDVNDGYFMAFVLCTKKRHHLCSLWQRVAYQMTNM